VRETLKSLRLALVAIAFAALAAISTTPAAGEPSFGVDPASGPPAGDILEPAPGSPAFGPLLAPVTTIGAGALGLPAASNIDAVSYGDDVFPPGAPWHVAFSVAPGSIGHPGSPPVSPMYPNVFLETVAGDGFVDADIYSSFNMAAPPFGAYAFAAPPAAPCGIHSNIQAADEDGLGLFALGFPNVGLGLVAGVDNVDSLEMLDNSFVDFIPAGGDGAPELPVFFSVDAATAGALGVIPPGGPVTPASILVWVPGGPLIHWAPPAALGLVAGDDIDAVAVGYVSGAPLGLGYAGAPDTILFSLTPGSPSVAGLPTFCFGPGSGTGGDVYGVGVLPGTIPILDAEMMGLSTVRSGGPITDNLDAIDIVLASGVDGDGDLLDDAVDMDDDNEGLGDGADVAAGCSPIIADTDGDGLNDYDEVLAYGTICTLPDTDGDGLMDGPEVNGMASPKAALGTLVSSPLLVDTDGDGCSDGEELGAVEMFGGRRDPMNPYDFYDIDGNGLIDLFIDIFGVAGIFGADADALPPGEPDGYLAGYDRGPPYANNWNLTGPDGLIDLFNDIFGVAFQFGHDCTAPP